MRTLRPHAPALLAAALVTLASWPVTGDMHPRLDLDGAWEIGLRQALHDGLDFGPDVVFTYGPLGFLREPLLVYPWSARLAFAWGALVQFALVATLIWGLRKTFGSLLIAALVALLLAAAIVQEPTVVIAFTGCVALTAGLVRGRHAQLVALGLGALCGIELLSKLNAGITLGLLAIVAVAAAPSPRRALATLCAGGALAAIAIGWLATGQSGGAIGPYLKGSLEVVSGYSDAMSFEDPNVGWEFWAAFLVIGLGFAAAWHAGWTLPGRAKAGLLGLWAVLAFTSFKAGFVRHDPAHANIFFASLLGGLVAFGWAPHRARTAWLVGAIFALALFSSLRKDPADLISPVARATHMVDQARLLADGPATRKGIEAARAERAEKEQLDQRFHAAIGDGTVHVEPLDAGLPWAQGLRWRPLPVFQSYSAYTADLDERNAAAVRSPSGPDFVLRENGPTFSDRNPLFDAPAAMRETLCHFREVRPLGRWILLERTAPRCGALKLFKTVEARLGVPAPVPAAPDGSSAVVVRIDGIGVTGLERLRAAIYRAVPRSITLDGGRVYPLVPGTAEDGLVLRVPPSADYSKPFGLDQFTEHADDREVGTRRQRPAPLLHDAHPPRERGAVKRLLALSGAALVVAVILRLPALNMPLDRDQGAYATIGQFGGFFDVLPYRDVFDHKQPLIYAVHWLLDLLAPRKVGAVRLAAAVPSALVAALVVHTLWPRIGPWRAALAAAVALLCGASLLVEGMDLNTEHLLVLTAALPVLVALRFERSTRDWVPLTVGVLVGLAALTKAVGVFVLPAALIPLLAGAARAERSALRTVVLTGAGLAVPLGGIALFYAAAGGLSDLWYTNYTYNRLYVEGGGDVPPGANAEVVALVRAGLVAGLVALVGGRKHAILTLTLLTWLAGAVIGAKLAARPVPHYFAPVLVPACALLFVPLLAGAGPGDVRASRVANVVVAAVVLVVAWPFATGIADTMGRNGSQLSYQAYGNQARVWVVAYALGEEIRRRSTPEDRMFVIGAEPEYYWTSGVRPASYYIYAPPGGFDEQRYMTRVARDVCSRPPRWVIDASALKFSPPLRCLARLPYEGVMHKNGVDVYELQRPPS